MKEAATIATATTTEGTTTTQVRTTTEATIGNCVLHNHWKQSGNHRPTQLAVAPRT